MSYGKHKRFLISFHRAQSKLRVVKTPKAKMPRGVKVENLPLPQPVKRQEAKLKRRAGPKSR